MNEADILREARERYRSAEEHDQQNREDAYDDLAFIAGQQWPESVRSARETAGSPVLTINRLPQFVRQVVGDMKQNRPAIRVRPVDSDADPETADTMSGLIRSIEQCSGASRHYTHAGGHAVSCGIGHFRVMTRYVNETSDEQEIAIGKIRDPLSVKWDPDSVEETREDARYCFVEQWYSKAAFEAEWPDARPTDWESASNDDNWSGWLAGEKVRVAEYWCKKTKKLWYDAEGNEVSAEDAKVWRDLDAVEDIGLKRREITEIVQYILSGDAILEPPTVFPGRFIPIIPVIGEEVPTGSATVRHGLIRYAKDPQRMYNYARSAQVEFGALQPKAPYVATMTMIEGHEEQWKSANVTNLPVLTYNADPDAPGMKPERQAPPMASQAWSQEVGISADDMKATTGIYDAGLGQRSNETSGVAIRQRQMESDTGTFTYIDNLSRSIEHAGKIMVEIIPIVYDTDRVIRILGEDDAESTARINAVIDPPNERTFAFNTGRYDTTVSVGPGYMTRRQEAAESMHGFIQSMPSMGAYIADLYVAAQDWPDKDPIVKRIRKMMPPQLLDDDEREEGGMPPQGQQQQPDPAAMASAQKDAAQAAKYAAETEKTKAETATILAELQANVAMIQGQLQSLGSVAGPPTGPPQAQIAPMQDPSSEAGFFMDNNTGEYQ